MKRLKQICLIGLSLCLLLLSGCMGKYSGPDANPEEVWICKEIPLFIHYKEIGFYGKTYYEDDECDIHVQCFNGSRVQIDTLLGPYILIGNFRIVDENQKTIIIDQDFNLLAPDYEELTVFRYSVDDVEWIDGWPVPRDGGKIDWLPASLYIRKNQKILENAKEERL